MYIFIYIFYVQLCLIFFLKSTVIFIIIVIRRLQFKKYSALRKTMVCIYGVDYYVYSYFFIGVLMLCIGHTGIYEPSC